MICVTIFCHGEEGGLGCEARTFELTPVNKNLHRPVDL